MDNTDRLLIRGAIQLLTLRGPSSPRRGPALSGLGIVENGALLVRNGVIEHVGPSHRVENLVEARRAREIDATGCIILPGFVDCHTQLLRSRPPFAHASASSSVITASRLRSQAQPLLQWMAMHGTTTAEVTVDCSADDPNPKALRVLQNLDGDPIELVRTVSFSLAPDSPGADEQEFSWWTNRLLPAVTRKKLARFAGAQFDGGYSQHGFRAFLESARAAGLNLRIRAPAAPAREAIRFAVEAGASALDLPGLAGADDIRLLAGSPVVVAVLPGAAFYSRSQSLPPARALIDSGAAVALATGFNAATAPSCSMAMILSLASILLGMTPAEAIAAATFNAACSLGCSSRTGSLEAGKQADFIIAAVHDYRELPYYFGVHTVARVFRRGLEITPRKEFSSFGAAAG